MRNGGKGGFCSLSQGIPRAGRDVTTRKQKQQKPTPLQGVPAHPHHPCSARLDSPPGAALGRGRGSDPEAVGGPDVASQAPRSRLVPVQCWLPAPQPPRRAGEEEEGGPGIGCALPGGPGPASPPPLPRPALQHRGQRPARALALGAPTAGNQRSRAPRSAGATSSSLPPPRLAAPRPGEHPQGQEPGAKPLTERDQGRPSCPALVSKTKGGGRRGSANLKTPGI